MRYYRAFQTAASERYLTGPIAQRIEHPPSKRVVAGSNPARSVFLEPCMALVLRQTSPWHFSQFLDSSSHPLPFGWQQTRRINNPEVSSRIPVTSILSIFWESPPVACNRSEAAKYAALYITGMAGFSLALIWRVIRLAIRILLLVAAFAEALATGNWKTVRDRAVIVLITLAKVFSAVAGILCPPAAYKIETRSTNGCPLAINPFTSSLTIRMFRQWRGHMPFSTFPKARPEMKSASNTERFCFNTIPIKEHMKAESSIRFMEPIRALKRILNRTYD